MILLVPLITFIYTVFVFVIDLVQSATTFREAAGIYHHLALNVLPHLKTVWAPEIPPEALASVSTVMSLICLAEAQVGVIASTFFCYFYISNCSVITGNLVCYMISAVFCSIIFPI